MKINFDKIKEMNKTNFLYLMRCIGFDIEIEVSCNLCGIDCGSKKCSETKCPTFKQWLRQENKPIKYPSLILDFQDRL